MIKHSEVFKREAVRIALTGVLPLERVAADLGIGKSTLGKLPHCLRRRPSHPNLSPPRIS